MKRMLLMIAALLVLAFPLVVAAETWIDPETGIAWTYSISDGKACVGSGSTDRPAITNTTAGTITVPAKINGCAVAILGGWAFYNCIGLAGIELPNGVTSIGRGAFEGCSGLKSMVIPESVTNIGDCAFYNCTSITNVVIPEGITTIGEYMFKRCSALESVTMPDSVTNIGHGAFWSCTALMEVTIPKGVTAISSNAFSNCSGLSNIVFCGNAPEVESDTFDRVASGCTATVYEGTTGWDDDGDGKWRGMTLIWRKLSLKDFRPTADEDRFNFVVSIEGVDLDSKSVQEHPEQLVVVEGSTMLKPDDFSADDVVITSATIEDGLLKFVAGPKDEGPAAFFMTVKLRR